MLTGIYRNYVLLHINSGLALLLNTFVANEKLLGGCVLELYWIFGISDKKLWIGFFIPSSFSAHSHTRSHYIHMCTCALCTSNIMMSSVVK